MSNEIKLCLCFSLMLPNHPITFWMFFHCFKFRVFPKLELILSRMILLSFPDLLLAGLISRHFGLFSKFSLWSLREINASRFFICSIRSPIPKLFQICFSSSSFCEMVPSDPCFYVFIMLSCISLLLPSVARQYTILDVIRFQSSLDPVFCAELCRVKSRFVSVRPTSVCRSRRCCNSGAISQSPGHFRNWG